MTQGQVDRNLQLGVILSVLWLAGIGSLFATIFGFRALKAIDASHGTLVGSGRAWWCLVVGGLGIFFWFPIIIVSVVNQF
jgi:hypothetical protein